MIYLVDEPLAETALRTAREDPDPTLVLIQDGVLLDPDLEAPTYALARDVELRGVELPDRIEPIGYDGLVEMLEREEVRSFA